MNLRAKSTFRAGDFARLEALIVPKLTRGVDKATNVVFQETQLLVAVDTGELKASGAYVVQWEGHKITGYIKYSAAHSAYVEFGTGARGASSPGAGPVPYSMGWKGQVAQPYCRPALDSKHNEVRAIIAGFIV